MVNLTITYLSVSLFTKKILESNSLPIDENNLFHSLFDTFYFGYWTIQTEDIKW
jgi:hypothetical protein